MGGCQNYVPFLGTLDIKCRIIAYNRDPKWTIMLTTTHVMDLCITWHCEAPPRKWFPLFLAINRQVQALQDSPSYFGLLCRRSLGVLGGSGGLSK